MDIFGCVPVVGEAADLLNAGIHLGRGNVKEAVLSIGAMIPLAGAGITAAKFGNKAIKAVTKNADHLDEVADAAQLLRRNADEAAQASSSIPTASNLLKSCFPAGTIVATAIGLRPIESIRSGEQVWSHDVRTGEWRLCHVLETFERYYDGHSVLVTVGNETIEATLLHPFWVVSGKGLDSRPFRDHHHTGLNRVLTPICQNDRRPVAAALCPTAIRAEPAGARNCGTFATSSEIETCR